MATRKYVVYSLSIVKNEADIIESFVRHNINIVDTMCIIDNGSFDNTVDIIEKLKQEGLSLYLLHDDTISYRQEHILTKHLKSIFADFAPDFLIPLDADEFIVHRDSHSDPRNIIEQLDNNKLYFIKWRSYVPHFSDNLSELYIPNRIIHAREDIYEDHFKVAIPKLVAQKYSISLTMGSHDILTDDGARHEICGEVLDTLRLAHFPVRSAEQLKSKVMVGWINCLSRHDRIEGNSFHWKNIFEKIKNNPDIVPEDLTRLAMEYSFIEDSSAIKIEPNPISLPFSNSIRLLYTQPANILSLKYLLSNCENLAMQYAKICLDSENVAMQYAKICHDSEKLAMQYAKICHDTSQFTIVLRMLFDIIMKNSKKAVRRINIIFNRFKFHESK